MSRSQATKTKKIKRKSIFRSLFIPLIAVIIMQTVIFYTVTMYGGLKDLLNQNEVDILSEKLGSKKREIENLISGRWTMLDDSIEILNKTYAILENEYGAMPLVYDTKRQIDFLSEISTTLIDTLRYSHTNGIFLIINDSENMSDEFANGTEDKYGICIRDLDQDNYYKNKEDLLLKRSPSSIIDSLGCLLDSKWEAKYSFESIDSGDYFYTPLIAAYEGISTKSKDLAFFSNTHRLLENDTAVVSYSLPLMSKNGFPYAVLGIELSVKYLTSLIPSNELYEGDRACYILTLQNEGSDIYIPITGTGSMFNRNFKDMDIKLENDSEYTGYYITGNSSDEFYVTKTVLKLYNNNSPFETKQLVLLAMVEKQALFSYVDKIKSLLMIISLVSLVLGIAALTIVSKRFASPITALAARVRSTSHTDKDYNLGHLGITEIDQLVDSIEELTRNVSKNSARSEFFSRMSHDMRTPMNAIISFSSQEMLENVDETVKDEYLSKIHNSGMYLLGLINEVLDMTKIESNKAELHMSAVPAEKLFITPVSMIKELAIRKNINFTADIKLPEKLCIMVDEQHLDQIVMNLLSNAVKFTSVNGKVSFNVDTVGDTPSEKLRIVVSDTGKGMSEQFLKTLYTPFEQENTSHEGTGLGLAIAKKLVELMDGSISCQSKQHVGTTFTLLIPLLRSECMISTQTANIPSHDISRLKGKHILVCEDNDINKTIITALLRRVGITVETAANGKIGVEMFMASGAGYYSAILMDIRMPVLNGLEATEQIRNTTHPDSLSIPIIAMTADAFAEDKASSLAVGMNDHISKPIEPDKLYETLIYLIKES